MQLLTGILSKKSLYGEISGEITEISGENMSRENVWLQCLHHQLLAVAVRSLPMGQWQCMPQCVCGLTEQSAIALMRALVMTSVVTAR